MSAENSHSHLRNESDYQHSGANFVRNHANPRIDSCEKILLNSNARFSRVTDRHLDDIKFGESDEKNKILAQNGGENM